VFDTVILSLLIGIFVGISAGYVGSLMVLEKMALVGDALSHVALPGLAIGLLFNFDPFIGAFIFLFASAAIICRGNVHFGFGDWHNDNSGARFA
jgi:ABC-type Mn2+/Zn2+ transport system permease subunit